MGTIVALGLAAAAYPQLLAVVVVILTRPTPQRLLIACYLGAVAVSAGCNVAVLLIFEDRGSVAGSTSHRLGAPVFFVIGAIAVAVAALTATDRGRALLGERMASIPRPRRPARARSAGPGSVRRLQSRATDSLSRGSVPVAAGVGVILGVPGPFDVLALGHMVRGGYGALALVVLVAAFIALKFLLIEIPIVSYAIHPDRTAARVDRFSAWIKTNQVRIVAAVVGVIGLILIGRGFSRLG